MEDIKLKRQQQYLDPLSDKEGREYLNNKKIEENYMSAQRAFKLVTQEREVLKSNNKFWSTIKQIK